MLEEVDSPFISCFDAKKLKIYGKGALVDERVFDLIRFLLLKV
ncbi:MAG: hypothetical protein RMH75_06490 [Archaeoglobaceae archaeon]|nr:hypothetical protein [Archaeoglobaceae archaeon]